MIIEIRPIETAKWHELPSSDLYSRPVKWPADINPVTRKYNVVLTSEDKDFFKDTNYNVSVDPIYDERGRLTPHPTWDSSMAMLKLPRTNTLVLNTDVVIDRLKYAVAKGCPLIAPNLEASKDGSYPEAEFYIYSDEVATEAAQDKVAQLKGARILSYKMSSDQKKSIVWIMDGTDVTGKTDSFVDVIIDRLIEKDPSEFTSYGSMKPEEVFTLGLIYEGIYKGVLIRDSGIRWGSEVIGLDEREAAKALSLKKNQALKVRIMEQMNK